MSANQPRFSFSLRFLLSLPLCMALWVAIGAATTSRAKLTQELQLPDGTKLVAKDIKRHNLFGTSTWLRRDVELIETKPGSETKIVHRAASDKLSPKEELLHPEIKTSGPNRVIVELYDDNSIKKLEFSFELSNVNLE